MGIGEYKNALKPLLIACYNRVPFMNTVRMGNRSNSLNCLKRMKHCRIICNGNNNTLIFERGGVLADCVITIKGDNNRVIIKENASSNQGELCIEDNNNQIVIGKGTALVGSCHLACIEGQSIEIGDDCLFSGNITFRTGDSHSILNLQGQRINPSAGIHVGEHVWIGNDVKVLKGVSIADHCIIGTGSLLTKSFVDKNVVIAGSPAKVVKRDIDWKTERV